jgi:transcriptional regulator with XRE-family HTH domain
MPLRTTAVEAAKARGWSKAEMSRRTGLSLSLIYNLAGGSRPGHKAIAAIMEAFPDLPFERLFVPTKSTQLHAEHSPSEPQEAVAAA